MTQGPAFYDHEADEPFPAPPVPRPIVPPGEDLWPGELPADAAPAEPPQQPVEPEVEVVAAEVAPPAEAQTEVEPEPEPEPAPEVEPEAPEGAAEPVAGEPALEEPEPVVEEPQQPEPAPVAEPASVAHVDGQLLIPEGYRVVEGQPQGGRAVGIVVSRFNGGITSQLLQSALDELEARGVGREAITIMPVPGAFELPIAAMALAKTRRFSCVLALGCVVRGETPHFDYVAGEAASGLQLAALETGVPIAFGVLTVDSEEQAQARIAKGAEAVQTGLALADSFARLRAAAASA